MQSWFDDPLPSPPPFLSASSNRSLCRPSKPSRLASPLKTRGPCSMRKISKGGYSKCAKVHTSAITKGSPLLHFFCEKAVFSSQVKEKKGRKEVCTKGAERRGRGGRRNYDRGPSAFPRKGRRPFRPGERGKGWKRTTNSKSAKVEARKREEKGRREGSRAASPPKKSGVNRGWRKKSPSFPGELVISVHGLKESLLLLFPRIRKVEKCISTYLFCPFA